MIPIHKKIISFLFITVMLFSLLAIEIKADLGPKSTIDLEIVGVNQPYYLEILIDRSNRIIKPLDLEELESLHLEDSYYQSDYPFHILNGYQDSDGFAPRVLYNGPPGSIQKLSKDTYKVGYFNAPKTFKIIIILEDDTIIKSEIVNRKLFNSSMTYDLTDVNLSINQTNVGEVSEDIPYMYISTSLLVRIFITISLEILVLFMFGYKLIKSYKIVSITNLLTQTVLSVGMALGFYLGSFFGAMGVLILGELIVFLTEMVLYAKMLDEKGRTKAIIYGFTANLATLILTVLTLGLL